MVPFVDLLVPAMGGAAVALLLALALFAVLRKQGFFSAIAKASPAPGPTDAATGVAPVATSGEKWRFTTYATLVLLILQLLTYAWCIGFGAFDGRVDAKSVSSLGRYGDYTLQIAGEVVRVPRAVNEIVKVGSHLQRKVGRPYLLVDEAPVVLVFGLGAFGFFGLMLMLLWAGVLWLVWSRPGR